LKWHDPDMSLGDNTPEDDGLLRYLMDTAGLSAGTARRVIDDVLAHHSETIEAYVIRRHRELSALGIRNSASFLRIQEEIAARPFRANACTIRQIRRIIYG
jgi:hypothetical protein